MSRAIFRKGQSPCESAERAVPAPVPCLSAGLRVGGGQRPGRPETRSSCPESLQHRTRRGVATWKQPAVKMEERLRTRA